MLERILNKNHMHKLYQEAIKYFIHVHKNVTYLIHIYSCCIPAAESCHWLYIYYYRKSYVLFHQVAKLFKKVYFAIAHELYFKHIFKIRVGGGGWGGGEVVAKY